MAPTVDTYISSFPHPTLPKIQGLPTYETIAEAQRLLNINAASVPTTLGGGLLGYLALTVSDAVYATHSGTPFVAPENPGPLPILPPGATQHVISETVRQFNERKRIWQEFGDVSQALKQQLLNAVDDIYVRTLRNRLTGFTSVTVRQLLEHLHLTYGRITPNDLIVNDNKMRTQYSADQPIEVLFSQLEDGVDYAAAGGQAYSPTQIVNLAYTLIFNTGQYHEACREWRRRPQAEKTWPNFKQDFALAHNDLREIALTTQAGGYHGANSATEVYFQTTAEALANLATATATDREAVANLVQSNATLTQQLAARDAEIINLTNQLQKLRNKNNNSGTANRNNNNNYNNNNNNRTRYNIRITPNNNYCWTHGYQCGANHTSKTCTSPCEGHKQEATAENPIGGSTYGKQA